MLQNKAYVDIETLNKYRVGDYSQREYGSLLRLAEEYWVKTIKTGYIHYYLNLEKEVSVSTSILLTEYFKLCYNLTQDNSVTNDVVGFFNMVNNIKKHDKTEKVSKLKINHDLKIFIEDKMNMAPSEEFRFLIQFIGLDNTIKLMYTFHMITGR